MKLLVSAVSAIGLLVAGPALAQAQDRGVPPELDVGGEGAGGGGGLDRDEDGDLSVGGRGQGGGGGGTYTPPDDGSNIGTIRAGGGGQGGSGGAGIPEHLDEDDDESLMTDW